MERKTVVASLLLAALSLSAIGIAAQHPQHHPPQATTRESKAASMMSERMMSGGMMAHHQEMETLVAQLLQSFAVLESEEDPAARKNRLAEHGALLEQLKSKFNQRSEMTQEMMDQTKNCPMMSGEHKQD